MDQRTKRCIDCGLAQYLKYYNKDTKGSQGVRAYCRQCEKVRKSESFKQQKRIDELYEYAYDIYNFSYIDMYRGCLCCNTEQNTILHTDNIESVGFNTSDIYDNFFTLCMECYPKYTKMVNDVFGVKPLKPSKKVKGFE